MIEMNFRCCWCIGGVVDRCKKKREGSAAVQICIFEGRGGGFLGKGGYLRWVLYVRKVP